jgi:ABC-type transport system involved in multi-copper enzyme maturation permease subunit
MTEDHKQQLPIILSFLDDARRIIEGGKGRRWEVFKWTVALNVIIATAAVTQAKPPIASYALFTLAFIVSVMASLLISHYDHRMTKARDRGRNLVEWLRTNASIDIYTTMGETKLIPAGAKDEQERLSFYIGIAVSVIAVVVALSISPHTKC